MSASSLHLQTNYPQNEAVYVPKYPYTTNTVMEFTL